MNLVQKYTKQNKYIDIKHQNISKINRDINGHTGTPKNKEKSCETVNGTHITRSKQKITHVPPPPPCLREWASDPLQLSVSPALQTGLSAKNLTFAYRRIYWFSDWLYSFISCMTWDIDIG